MSSVLQFTAGHGHVRGIEVGRATVVRLAERFASIPSAASWNQGRTRVMEQVHSSQEWRYSYFRRRSTV